MKKQNTQSRATRRTAQSRKSAQNASVQFILNSAQQSAEKHTAQSSFFEKYVREQSAEQKQSKKQNVLTTEREFTKKNIMSVMNATQNVLRYEREKKNVLFYSTESRKNVLAVMYTSKRITVMCKHSFESAEYHKSWEHKFVVKCVTTAEMLTAVQNIITAQREQSATAQQSAEQSATA